MPNIVADYETRCDLDLPKVGRQRYVNHPSADIVCLSYKVENDPTRLWVPGLKVPKILTQAGNHYFAFNSKFDQLVNNVLGKRYGLRSWQLPETTDAMALCGRYTFPQKLEKAGTALRLPVQKDRRGKYLMGKICSPPYKYTQEELKEFYKYCIRDVDTLYHLLRALPSVELDPQERALWEHTCRVNDRGLPIDVAAVARIQQVIEYYTRKEEKKLPRLTGGKVTKATQRDRILKALKTFDVELPNLQAGTVDDEIKLLTEFLEAIPATAIEVQKAEKALELLTIRKNCGGAAIKKFVPLMNMTYNGRLSDTIQYCGALHTGRDSGRGFQLQNLPRAAVDDVPGAIQKFYDTTILKEKDPLATAKALVRGMIRARPGWQILASDLSSIEYVLLMWYCKEWDKLDKFESGICPYKTFAVSLFGVPYEQITKKQRQDSKPGILGGGYCLSGRTLIGYAADMNVEITSVEEGNRIIGLYREQHEKVAKIWDRLVQSSVMAVSQPERLFSVNTAAFLCTRDRVGRRWLCLKLPSGRFLYYADPIVDKDNFGRPIVKHMGQHNITKQWTRHTLRSSVLINNIIQGSARDIVMPASIELERIGYHVIGRVHDEIICEEEIESEQTLERMIEVLSRRPAWCQDAPIRATGFADERYRKD